MSPTRKFLIKFALIYAIGAILGLIFLGPPGLSGSYEDEYAHEHEHYLEIIKSQAYKLHRQNPELHPASDELAERIAFVEEYESREAFQREQNRLFWFNIFFETYNGLALVILAVRFGKQPLLNFLDERIADIRTRLDTAEQARKRAATELQQAENQMAGLEHEKAQIEEQSRNLVASVTEEIRSTTAVILEQLDQEGTDRRAVEEQKIAQEMKKQIVRRAIDRLETRLKQESNDEFHHALVEQFARDVEEAR